MLTYIALVLIVCGAAASEITPRAAIVHLSSGVIQGNITFRQNGPLEPVQVEGSIVGLNPGKYGFHIHEKGDLSGGCLTAGAHFNPYKKNHGAPDVEDRHVGDLGNVEFGSDQVAHINVVDKLISLYGERSILGRALVLHDGTDDLGLGKQPDSLTTGHAGGRAACGVIGIMSPIDPWNGSSAITASFFAIFLSSLITLGITY